MRSIPRFGKGSLRATGSFGGAWCGPFKTLAMDPAVFREETGHEIGWRGVVRVLSRVGHHPLRAIGLSGNSGVRAIWPSVISVLRADNRLGFQEMRAVYPFGEEGCGPMKSLAGIVAGQRKLEGTLMRTIGR